jgi:hypothetical protein
MDDASSCAVSYNVFRITPGRQDCVRVTGKPECAGLNRHVGVSKEGWRIQ